jgi:DNA invertase Pin-like site-specific DNA recombinase
MGKVWGYVRVSTDDQDNSIQNQIERIKEQAAKEGLPLAMIYVDEAVTGKIPLRNRPQGRLLWDAMSPGDVIVFNKVDRVFRSVRDATDTVHTWLDKGISPVILDLGIDLRTPAGRLFFHQLASFAEFEREMIGQRVREVQSYLRKHGLPRGNRPYGWQRDRPGKGAKFVPLESERQLAERIVRMHADGTPYSRIAWALMRERVTKPGKKWTDAGKGVWYSTSEIHGLATAHAQGFPIVPRRHVRVGGTQDLPSEC